MVIGYYILPFNPPLVLNLKIYVWSSTPGLLQMSLVILVIWSSFSVDYLWNAQGFFPILKLVRYSIFSPSADSAQSLIHLGLVVLVPTSQSTWNLWCVEVLIPPLVFLQVPLEDSFASYKIHWLTSSFLEYLKYVTSFSVARNVAVKKSRDNNFLCKYFFFLLKCSNDIPLFKVQLILFEYILAIIIWGHYSQVFGVAIQYLITHTCVYFLIWEKFS